MSVITKVKDFLDSEAINVWFEGHDGGECSAECSWGGVIVVAAIALAIYFI